MSQRSTSGADEENGGQQPEAQGGRKQSFSQVVQTLMIVRNWLLSVQPEELIEERRSQLERTSSSATLKNTVVQSNRDVEVADGEPLGFRKRATQMLMKITCQTVNGAHLPYYLWTTLVTMACFYNLISILALASFDLLRDAHETAWLIADYFCDTIFLFDIFVQSRKCYMEDGLVVTNLKKLARNYVKSKYFWLDVIAVLPTDVLYVAFPNQSLVRLNRLVKCHRIGDFSERTEMRSNFPNTFRLLKLSVVVFVLYHWNACVWFIISKNYGIGVMNTNSWTFSYAKIRNPIMPTCDAWHHTDTCTFDESNYTRNQEPPLSPELNRASYSDVLDNFWANKTETWIYANLTRQYTLSFYWSFMISTLLGEQSSPVHVFQFTYETMDILVGLFVFATILGNVGSVVSNLNAQKADFDQMLDGVKHYMKYRQVNPEIQSRVISWFGYVWSQGQTVDDDAITSQLPRRLQGELAIHVHLETLKRVKIFQDCEPGLLYELVLKLKLQVFSPSDYICRKGDIGKEMYIVKRGSLNVVSDDGSIVFVTLTEGAVFGELSILDIPGNKNGNKRTAAVRSVGYSDLYVLSKNDLWDALRQYPEARKLLLAKGRELLKKDGLLLNDSADDDDHFGPNRTLDEKLDHLEGQLGKLDRDIAKLEKEFQEASARNKKRITHLEHVFTENKKQIKRDCLLGILQ